MNSPEPLLAGSAEECKDAPKASVPPCKTGSPLGINYGALAALTASGKEKDACRELRRATPFGGLLAVLGDPFAEALCPKQHEQPFIPRLLSLLEKEYPDILYRPLEDNTFSGKRALVIGSGPAGLQAAWTLREHGHAVTVLEAAAAPGVTLLHAPVQESSSAPSAPSPAVPEETLKKTVAMLTESGIEFRCASPVGQAVLDSLLRDYDIVLCACGKGAVLPTDADGKVKDNLFAAGTCVKNQKGLGALQSMAFARKAALSACRILSGVTEEARNHESTPLSDRPENDLAARQDSSSAPAFAAGSVHSDALLCISCLKN